VTANPLAPDWLRQPDQAGVNVPYRLATPAETAAEPWKFTTTNGGTSIVVRGAR